MVASVGLASGVRADDTLDESHPSRLQSPSATQRPFSSPRPAVPFWGL